MAFSIEDYDEKVSDWAVEQTPIFGSVEDAKDASDLLRTVLVGEAFATALLVPVGEPDSGMGWLINKVAVEGVELAAWQTTSILTSSLKDLADRKRPDGQGDNSFPSGHTSGAFSAVTLANRNLDVIPMNSVLRMSIQIGNIGLASAVGWARIEGNRHFPSDVFAGAALGRFLTIFIHDAFMADLESSRAISLFIEPYSNGGMVYVNLGF